MVGGPEVILLYIFVVVVAAKIGGEIASRLHQPVVAGEILMGVLIGPSLLNIIPAFEVLDAAADGFRDFSATEFQHAMDLHVLAILAEIGVLILLFEVGLESNLNEFKRVGAAAGLVGVYGVVFSLVIGAAASFAIATQLDWVLTDTAKAQPELLHVFVGATLAATSVGITARVLGDMGKIRTKEAQIILGAAVFDDILGLIVLAIISGLVAGGAVTVLGVGKVLGLAFGFFIAAVVIGVYLGPRLLDVVHRSFKNGHFVHLAFAFTWMILGAFLATLVGLASIVGAFAAGLGLSVSSHRHVIFEHLKPVGSLFVSFFFVILGARVDLSQITPSTLPLVLGIGVALSAVGILAKLAAGLGVVRTAASKYIVGVGMVPRGEVGLIFALFGLEQGLLNNWQYTTVIIVVLLTTLITPSWLKALRGRFVGEPTPTPPGQARLEDVVD